MYLSIVFPVADFRGLHNQAGGRLARPSWGKADPQAKFARGFGAIHNRTKPGSLFPGEGYYADFDAFVRYPKLIFTNPLAGLHRPILAYPIYRRFYFDGLFAGRFEFGFRLNEGSLTDVEISLPEALYDLSALAKQMFNANIEAHLIDGRVMSGVLLRSMKVLREGYLLSSTKNESLATYDILAFGPKYVEVGSPFIAIRSSPWTPTKIADEPRELLRTKSSEAFLIRSGEHERNLDTLVISSQNDFREEDAEERLVRLIYTYMRTIAFGHSVYVRRVEEGIFPATDVLKPAIAKMLERITSLAPVEGSSTDAELCGMITRIVQRSGVDPDQLAKEVSDTVRPNSVKQWFNGVFGYLDKKTDVAIEAAASTATKKLLSGGL